MIHLTARTIALIVSLLVLIGIAIAAWARLVAPGRLQLTHTIMPVPRRHAHLNGLRIAFVSDTHVGVHFHPDDLQATVAALRRAQPDILILGGDYISESPRFIAPAASALEDMAATARLGTWAVLGNHDVANSPDKLAGALRAAGIGMLINEHAEVVTDRGSLWLVGIDDAVLGTPDLRQAFVGIPGDAATIAIWHEPDCAEEVVPYDPLFMLSGHTHGGQVRLPGLGPLVTPVLGKRYVEGRFDIDGMPLYVSRGVGMYRPPIRLACPPELVIVTLLGETDTASSPVARAGFETNP